MSSRPITGCDLREEPIALEQKPLLQKAIPLIIAWYRANQRPLPWRLSPTPYHIWISETMLQQTRIETVIPYYERFLQELPTVKELAETDDDKLMKLWEGLGYYSRAKNLKKAAQIVCSAYEGKLPENADELRKLPGIGEYTAGAIASIAFGRPEPAVDGNVLRVLTRLTACEDDILAAKTKKSVTETLRKLYPSGREASLLTEGIMELGEVICIPNGTPLCQNCPLQKVCLAHRSNTVSRYPVKSPKKERKTETLTVFLLSCNGKYALRQREEKGLLAGMWEFPNEKKKMTKTEAESFLSAQGIQTSCRSCGKAKHIFTHIEWRMNGYRAECREESPLFIWKTASEIQNEYAIPSAFRFYWKQIFEKEAERNP